MLGFYNYKSYTGMLNNFIDTVENDTSSILYHTRVFDDLILNSILNQHTHETIEVVPYFFFCNQFELIAYFPCYSNFFFILYKDIFFDLLDIDNLFFNYSQNSFFNYNVVSILFSFFLNIINNDYTFFNMFLFLLFFQKNELFTSMYYTVNIFSDFLFSFDIFLIIIEILLFLFLFLLLFNKVSNFFITTKFYDNILSFFKYNNISFLEISITCTLFLSFYVFDIFLSFSEDDFSDTFFYIILLFILLMFFFLSIALDIQYFYSMSNVSNGDISLRLLFFDILNNFLGILRIFLC